MRRAALLVALSTSGLTACAAIGLSRGPDPEDRLRDGVAALRVQDFARARAVLEPLYLQHWSERTGQRAMLMLATLELDPRNPERHLYRAADVSGRLLNVPELDGWLVPLAEAHYLLAVELGAHEQRIAAATDSARAAGADSVRSLPSAQRETVPARMHALEAERDGARERVAELEALLATRDRELKEAKQEVERLKKTIKGGGPPH